MYAYSLLKEPPTESIIWIYYLNVERTIAELITESVQKQFQIKHVRMWHMYDWCVAQSSPPKLSTAGTWMISFQPCNVQIKPQRHNWTVWVVLEIYDAVTWCSLQLLICMLVVHHILFHLTWGDESKACILVWNVCKSHFNSSIAVILVCHLAQAIQIGLKSWMFIFFHCHFLSQKHLVDFNETNALAQQGC